MRIKHIFVIAIWIYSFAGVFGGLFLIAGQYMIYNGHPVTYPIDGILAQEFGVFVSAFSLVMLIASSIYIEYRMAEL